jgi:C4-dicarboxylate transporter, DctM subunit
VIIYLIIILLGCFLDSMSMILLFVPIFLPSLILLDFGYSVDDTKIWFGILMLIIVELGLITPPVGLNICDSRSI